MRMAERPVVGVWTMGTLAPLIFSRSAARNCAAWRTMEFSAAPTTISLGLDFPATITLPCADPVSTQEPRSVVDHGAVCAQAQTGRRTKRRVRRVLRIKPPPVGFVRNSNKYSSARKGRAGNAVRRRNEGGQLTM